MKRRLYFAWSILFFSPLIGTSQYLIRFKVTNPTDSVLLVKGTVFNDKNFFTKDTVRLYKGIRQSINRKSIVGGIYYLEFPASKQKIFFTLENKDTVTFTFDGNQPLSSITCSKKTNQVFLDYQRLEKDLSVIDTLYHQELKRGRKFNLIQKDAFFVVKRDSLMNFRKAALLQLKPGEVLSLHFKTLNTLDEYLPKRSEPASRESFIRKFDLNQERLLFTDNLQNILFEYLSAFPLKADSLNAGIDNVLSRIQCNNKSLPYVMDYFVRIMKNRNVQNNSEGIISMIDKHIIKSKCPFPNESKKNEYLKLYEDNKKLNANDLAKNIVLKDTLGTEQNLHQFAKEFDYTVILFYAPTCEHCQVEIPQMDSTIKVMEKKYDITIGKFAICNEPGIPNAVWKNFILKNKLNHEYVHVQLPDGHISRNDYGAYSNPISFLIDKDAKMLGRKISPISFKNILNTILADQ
jgi:thiol-disulfide isomerase/thioredoxin